MYEHRPTSRHALPGSTPSQAASRFVTRYFTFAGRASRSEFWWWLLTFVVVSIALALLNKAIVGPAPSTAESTAILQYSFQTSILQLVWTAVNFIGAAALTVRRLHDIGLAGAWWFIQLVPKWGRLPWW